MNQFATILQEIAGLLQSYTLKLVTAESCTGGLIASYITDIPGSSAWFERGFITYSNLAKQEMLGVPQQLIQQFGAVSEEVAAAMALGALHNSKGDLALSVTGIAGPDGGSAEKPVGTVCLAWAMGKSTLQTLKTHFPGTRQEVRIASCQKSLEGALIILNNIPIIPH